MVVTWRWGWRGTGSVDFVGRNARPRDSAATDYSLPARVAGKDIRWAQTKGKTMAKDEKNDPKQNEKPDTKPEDDPKAETPTAPMPLDLAPMRPIDKDNPKGVRQISRDALAKNLQRADLADLQAACAMLEIPITGKVDILRRRITMKQCGGKMEYVASGTICASCFNVVAITHTEEKYRRFKCTSCGRRGEIRCE